MGRDGDSLRQFYTGGPDLLRPCPFEHWWYLPREHRRRLRNLFAYQFTGGRLAHLTDAEPRCTICRTNLRSVA